MILLWRVRVCWFATLSGGWAPMTQCNISILPISTPPSDKDDDWASESPQLSPLPFGDCRCIRLHSR